jgi:FkbH-like protein
MPVPAFYTFNFSCLPLGKLQSQNAAKFLYSLPMSHPDGIDLASLSVDEVLIKRKGLRRKLAARENLQPIRIAVLGGSTTQEVVDFLELRLLDAGFAPTFHQSEYGRFYVDAVHDTNTLVEFQPHLVYVHTSVRNIQRFAPMASSEAEFEEHVKAEMGLFQEIWTSLEEKIGCLVIQNNFEFPPYAILGNLDATAVSGHTRFVSALNLECARKAASSSKLLVQDICSISARMGLEYWFDYERWFSYKIVTTPDGSDAIANSLTAMIRAIYGKTRKVLVLDLDNTLWGGVIGDDGVEKIQIGRETPVAEAYSAFQQYCLSLRNRGILLAVCSKNSEETAKLGFEHPDSILKLEHISCFKANWQPKHENIVAIAEELNLGADSFVFVDDNPAEREIVRAQIDGIAVPDVGDEVAQFSKIIEAGRYFEQISLSREDFERAALYENNNKRALFESKFADYGEYLDSLSMTAEIGRFKPIYLERIAQLTNKTNQFNLTTRRYTFSDIESILDDPDAIGIYGRLNDRFGDNGLISVVLGHRRSSILDIDLWLMSCRVLKRDMELAMLDSLVEHARGMGIAVLYGHYLPTKKNAMVKDHYSNLGFEILKQNPDGSAIYSLEIKGFVPRNTHIKIMETANEQ